MKLSLTYKFDSRAELDKHLAQMDAANGVSNVQASTPAPARSRAKAKTDTDVLANVEMPVAPMAHNAFPENPRAPISPIPAALQTQQAPVQPIATPQAPAFDRNVVLSNISSTVNDLKTQGAQDQMIAKLFANIFSKMAQPICKLGELADEKLAMFNQLFYPEVQMLRASWAPQAANSNSFI